MCKITLLKSNFNKNKTKKDGYRSECRSCCRKFYYNNRDQLLNNMNIDNKQNREKTSFYEIKKKGKMISILNYHII